MDFRNCPQCGKLFKKIGRNLCPACIEKEEKMFDIVREYVRDNPNANVMETSEATGVPEKVIMQFLRDGRLLSGSVSIALDCQSCGKPISAGQYCPDCLEKFTNGFGNSQDRVKPESGWESSQRMYTADRLYKKNRD